MSEVTGFRLIKHDAPGERRAVLLDADGRACRLFLLRWNGKGERARVGSVHHARVRTLTETLAGAFVELESGEEAFLRLKSRDGLTEGTKICVEIVSEARDDKLARVSQSDRDPESYNAWDVWRSNIGIGTDLEGREDPDEVAAAFDEALVASFTLPGGGQLHIDRTRALTAFDIDTAGRVQKGSAGARALSINKTAVTALARHVALRNLGGNLILDCLGPLNRSANTQLRSAAIKAFEFYGLSDARILAPSPLGMMEMSVPWRETPLASRLESDPGETELLDLFKNVQREASANPTGLFELALSKAAHAAYLRRRIEADAELTRFFGGRVTISPAEAELSKVQKR